MTVEDAQERIDELAQLVRVLAPLALDAANDEPYDWAIEEPQYWEELTDEQIQLLRDVMAVARCSCGHPRARHGSWNGEPLHCSVCGCIEWSHETV